MAEEIINDIYYRLDEENLTAEVIQKDDYRGDIIIPDAVVFNEITYRVTSIEELAFEGCSFLTSITIPNSVTNIGKGAFVGCKTLTSIIVIEGNTVYDSRDNCNAIIEKSTNTLICGCTNTTIPNSVTSIGERAFDCCYSLTSITIPDSVKSIGWKAFSGCSLTSITIPNSVTNIGKDAFLDCESLFSITYQGTIAQWEEIILQDDWNNEVPAKVVHCTDGDVEI